MMHGTMNIKSCDGIFEVLPTDFNADENLMWIHVEGPFRSNGIKIRLTRLSWRKNLCRTL